MPRVSFEPKVTLSGIVQIVIMILGGAGVYFTLANATANATKDLDGLKPAVVSLQQNDATFNTRLTVVESRAETQAKEIAEMARAVEQLTATVQSLTVTAATTKTDVGYIRDWVEQIKREAREQ